MPSTAPVTETSTKYGPGQNPRSRANLKPFPKGASPSPGNPIGGPLLTPAIRRYAHLTTKELMSLNVDTLPAIDAVAVVTLLKGIDPKWGDRSRELLANRLDGSVDKPGIEVQVGVAVQLTWNGGREV